MGEAGRPRRPAARRHRRQLRRRLPVPRRRSSRCGAKGKPVFDALAPADHLVRPEREPRARGRRRARVGACPERRGAPTSDSLPPNDRTRRSSEGTATGQLARRVRTPRHREHESSSSRRTARSWHVAQGRRLDIPVLFGQGTTDTLFNLQQGLANWQHALTEAARKQSIFVGYNGGHVLPGALPQGATGQLADRRLQRAARGRRLHRPRRSASWTSSSRDATAA